ncbi:hypothetical protein [Methylobacterium sp. J-070]|uniref:hypothetical protein n=1 Tax=Methylobacterium sp. J-070 TaxID=2836650 RepID=UPI001FB9BC0C|nr:hypothetical protein [Methylobacterium sp. J-070]MCJ2048685.1 hypothetical protein [Methylobacterium sp. J-070]
MNLPIANIRQDRHVASYVSLGRSRSDLKTVLPASPRTAAQILAERDAAQAERETLEDSRSDVLVNGSVEDLLALDTRIALAKVRQDQATAQHAAAVSAEAAAQAVHEAEQKRRKDLHRKAMKASDEVEKLATEYVTEAQRLVPLLSKIRERAALIDAANYALPDGADPVPPGEPRYSFEGRSDQPHSTIASRVRLPALGTDAGYIWGEIAPIHGRIVHEPH